MTKKIEDGGPAFPHMAADGHPDYRLGLTVRDWFAGQALSGAISAVGGTASCGSQLARNPSMPKTLSELAYDYADAMLAARKPGGDA